MWVRYSKPIQLAPERLLLILKINEIKFEKEIVIDYDQEVNKIRLNLKQINN